jgi:hypothetical protein
MVVKPDKLTRDKTRVESNATRVDPKLLYVVKINGFKPISVHPRKLEQDIKIKTKTVD